MTRVSPKNRVLTPPIAASDGLFDTRRNKQRLAHGAAEEADQRLGDILLRAGAHRHGDVRGVILDFRREGTHKNQAVLLLQQDFGNRTEGNFPALAKPPAMLTMCCSDMPH